MRQNNVFDIKRLSNLLIRQARLNGMPLLIGTGAAAGIIIFIYVLAIINGAPIANDKVFFSSVLPTVYIAGLIFTSAVFNELQSPQRGYLLLSLPASNLEKLIASWLLTSIVYIIYAIVAMFIINLIISLFAILISSHEFYLANFFAPEILKNYAVYLVIQPIFLLGALYFKKVNFLKTLFALFLVAVVILIYTVLVARIIIFPDFREINFNENTSPNIKNFVEFIIVPVSKAFFWICMAPFFLVVSYFRLKERQV